LNLSFRQGRGQSEDIHISSTLRQKPFFVYIHATLRPAEPKISWSLCVNIYLPFFSGDFSVTKLGRRLAHFRLTASLQLLTKLPRIFSKGTMLKTISL